MTTEAKLEMLKLITKVLEEINKQREERGVIITGTQALQMITNEL